MEHSFQGKLASTKVADMSTGVMASAGVSTPLFEQDVEAFLRFMPATALKLKVSMGGKEVTEIDCKMSGAREATTKDGTFIYATFRGEYSRSFDKLFSLCGEKMTFTMTLDPEEQELALEDED